MSPLRTLRQARRHKLITAYLVALLALWIYVAYQARETRAEQNRVAKESAAFVLEQRAFARSTTKAVCSLREDLERRVAASRDFLADHPHGIPGIPRVTILLGIENQQRTIDALHALKCAIRT